MIALPITGKRGVGGATVLIDERDLAFCEGRKIFMAKEYPAISICHNGRHTNAALHRVLLGLTPKDGVIADHANGNKFDARRENLRIADASKNMANTFIQKRNRSGYKGVLFKGGRYYAQFRQKYIGSFDDAEAAARAYDAVVMQVYGEFARLNFPGPGEASCRRQP